MYYDHPITFQGSQTCARYLKFILLVIVFGVMINKKLFKLVRNDKPGERGKVFQQILASYAVIQSIGWPFILVWMIGIGILLQIYGQTIPACFYVNCVHIGVFSYIFLRTYYLNSAELLYIVVNYQQLKFETKKLDKFKN